MCLLELCSLDTEMLRVDVQTAKRIYLHYSGDGKHRRRKKVAVGSESSNAFEDSSESAQKDSDVKNVSPAEVIEFFLSFPEVRHATDPLKDDVFEDAIDLNDLQDDGV